MAGEEAGLSGLARRYASALFELADDRKELDTVAEELGALKQIIAESEDLRSFIRSPLYGRDDQSRAMTAILDKAGAGDLSRRFVLIVAQNRRLFALSQMIDAYLEELARRRGEVTAQVVTAQELSEAQKSALLDTLKQAVGSKVQMDITVDGSLIGGLVVKVGSRMIDTSLRSKLQRLELAMKGAG
ncbi:MAG: F0F1 ATP synthase subunit delta [Kiloniellales bacterium]